MSEKQFAPVKKLPIQTAQKIAAGEVIDRPAAVVRELLDNSIDAGASKITVEITGGGIDRIRVVDNGGGMTKEDLELCTHTHTTSKISSADDLLRLQSLGFRGEALSSVSAVSHLSIISIRTGYDAWKLVQSGFGGTVRIEPARLNSGTIIDVAALFENFPARKKFLKRPTTERTMCKHTFIEKAMPHFTVAMNLSAEGKTVIALPAHSSYKQRCLAAKKITEPENLFYELRLAGNGFSGTLVIGSTAVMRKDKRDIVIFVNNRRITEYSLVQAICYGSEGAFPNGTYPCAFLFLQIDPALVDFNIHPAKREARIQIQAAIHHAVSKTVADFYKHAALASVREDLQHRVDNEHAAAQNLFPQPFRNAVDPLAAREKINFSQSMRFAEKHAPRYNTTRDGQTSVEYSRRTYLQNHSMEPNIFYTADHPIDRPDAAFKFLGQVLGTFLAVEKAGVLYLIDQHAAHERILFDELRAEKEASQELLIPYRITTASPDDDEALEKQRAELHSIGFRIQNEGAGEWQITAVPARWTGTEQNLQRDLVDAKKHPKGILHYILATAACRAACKDGDILDPVMAYRLAERAFNLPEPFCPHGRPIWTKITREELFERVKRT